MIHYKPRYAMKELPALLSISNSSIYTDIKAGKLQTYTIGKRRFADASDIESYVALCRKEAK